MDTIHKTALMLTGPGVVELNMPRLSKFLSVGVQNIAYAGEPVESVVVWYRVFETETPKVVRRLVLAWTGQPFPEADFDIRFLGTVQQGPVVWHVWVEVEK